MSTTDMNSDIPGKPEQEYNVGGLPMEFDAWYRELVTKIVNRTPITPEDIESYDPKDFYHLYENGLTPQEVVDGGSW